MSTFAILLHSSLFDCHIGRIKRQMGYMHIKDIFSFIYDSNDLCVCILHIPLDIVIAQRHPNLEVYYGEGIYIEKILPLWDLYTIQYIVSLGVDIHKECSPILQYASRYGYLDIAEYAVCMGADVHVCGPMQLASKGGWLNIVQYFVSLGVDVRAYNDQAIFFASNEGHLHVVQYLVSVGASVSDRNLHFAANNGHLDVVKYIVSLGVDICPMYCVGFIWASQNGHLNVVKYLVSMGANIHAADDDALRWASRNGHVDVVQYLVSLGAVLREDNSKQFIEK